MSRHSVCGKDYTSIKIIASGEWRIYVEINTIEPLN